MYKSGQNSIHSVQFNLAYAGKQAAIKNQNLIESRFTSHLAPELEKTIAKIIPDKVSLELPRVELDLGTVNENELIGNLKQKITAALEKELSSSFKIEKEAKNPMGPATAFQKDTLLFDALEVYLESGYFPFWVQASLTFEDLFGKALQQSKTDVVQMLRTQSKKEHALRRLANGLSPSIFDKLVAALEPVNAQWIFEFRKTLFSLKDDSNLHQWSAVDFAAKVHFLILKHLLNSTSVRFNASKFTDAVVAAIPELFKNNPYPLIREMLGQKEMDLNGTAPPDSPDLLQRVQPSPLATDDEAKMSLEILLKSLNKSSHQLDDSHGRNTQNSIVEILKNPQLVEQFIGQLNNKGVLKLLELFDPNNASRYLKQLTTLTDDTLLAKLGESVKTKRTAWQAVLRATILYLNEGSIRQFGDGDYVFFLLGILGIDPDKAMKSAAFRQFIKDKVGMGTVKFKALIKQEIEFPTVANVQETLMGSVDKHAGKDRPRSLVQNTEAYFDAYRKHIVRTYLVEGKLPDPYSDLTQDDVYLLYQEILDNNSNFIGQLIRSHTNIEALVTRLAILLSRKNNRDIGIESLLKALPIGDDKTHLYLQTLYHYLPASLGGLQDEIYCSGLLIRFSINSYQAKKRYSAKQFSKDFMTYVWLQFQQENAARQFDVLIQRMKLSKQSLLEELATYWDVEGKNVMLSGKTLFVKKNDKGARRVHEGINSRQSIDYVALLAFYGQNGFFPWWSTKKSIVDVLLDLEMEKKANAKLVEEICSKLCNDADVMRQLLPRLSKAQRNRLRKLIAKDGPIKTRLDGLLQELRAEELLREKTVPELLKVTSGNDKKMIDVLFERSFSDKKEVFQGMYFLDDREILKHWTKEFPKIVEQVAAYISLAPYFYFRYLSPIKWRQMIYWFGAINSERNIDLSEGNFHSKLLNFLNKTAKNIEWSHVLRSVYHRELAREGKTASRFPDGMLQLIKDESDTNAPASKPMREVVTNVSENGKTVIYNAGLILFWPFLTRCFEQLSLVDKNQFVNRKCREKAVYILQYLAYNQLDFPEHHLVLNKILVGMPADGALFSRPNLTEGDKKLVESMIQGLIGNWEKVKNSSPAAIQETFIQRQGTLTFKKGGIALQVEKKGVDVLLGSIPWNVSLVKLPWMKNPLHVAWI